MDLLDLIKLVARRWYAALPVVLVTIVGTLALGSSIRPEYKTSAAVVLVPPTTQVAAPAAGQSPQPGNPWLRVGEDQMAQAVIFSVESHDARARVAAAGGDPAYEIGQVTRSSIMTIDVTAETPQAALATVRSVIGLIQAEVSSKQADYKPKPGEEITTQILDPGDNVTASRSNVLRAQIVVIALGFLLATVSAVVVDAVYRRRAAAGRPGRARHVGRDGATGSATVGGSSRASTPAPELGTGDSSPTRTPVSAEFVRDSVPRSDDTIMLSAVRGSNADDGEKTGR